ncbi:hypothetical protein [Caulobacter sp. DWR2-3-1b2]|uniref:hypothetical protein n=1 Tax=unclassified Caulobacter TaxID=2648921 RepID=UPI003CECA5C4
MRVKPRTRRWLGVGAASLALHGLLGWALLAAIPPGPVPIEPRSVVVELTAAAPAKPPEPRHEQSKSDDAPAVAPVAVPGLAALPPPVAASPSPPAPPARQIVAPPGFTARGTLTGGGEALRQAARRSSCTEADIVKLTTAERQACAEALGARNKNGPALYAAIDPEKKAGFDGGCRKDDDWCLYRAGKGPYPGLFAVGKKKKRPGWDD